MSLKKLSLNLFFRYLKIALVFDTSYTDWLLLKLRDINYQEYYQYQSKKNQQCDLIVIKSKIKENPALVKFAEDAGKDPKIQRDLNALIEQLRLGNEFPGIGTKTLFKDVKEARARNGARVDFRKRNGKIEILAKLNKNPKGQKAVIKILRKKYG